MFRVAALVLAAGRGCRFDAGDGSKAAALVHGVPLVRAVAASALASRAASIVVVTGHARAEVEAALRDLAVRVVHNADFATGLAGSLKTGIASLPNDIDGALVLLADMPFVRPATLDALIAHFVARRDHVDAVVPVFDGRRGNPVLIGKNLFDRLQTLSGDEGARRLLSAPGVRADPCVVEDAGIAIDIDTRAAWEGFAGSEP